MRDRLLGVSVFVGAMSGMLAITVGCGKQEQAVVNAADTYQIACMRCHGANGKGPSPAVPADVDAPRPRDFSDAAWQASMTDESITTVIREGKGAMPAFGDALTDFELEAAARSVRSFSE